jgi:hypothetical protein
MDTMLTVTMRYSSNFLTFFISVQPLVNVLADRMLLACQRL